MKNIIAGLMVWAGMVWAAPGWAISVGDEAPVFKAKSIDGKGSFDLSAYQGKKPVLVNIFNTWCGPCHKETPAMVKIYDTYKKDIEFVSICTPWSGDSVEKAAKFVKQYKMPWMMTFDDGGSITESYEVKGVPTNCVVGKDGKVLFYVAGALQEDQMTTILDAAVAGKVPQLPGMGAPEQAGAKIQPAGGMKEGTPWVGIKLRTEEGDDEDVPLILISEVVPDGPAEEAGLQADDEIQAIDGKKYESVEDLVKAIRSHKAGEKVEFKVGRGKDVKTIVVTVGAFSAPKND